MIDQEYHHEIYVVRTHTGVVLRQDNDNVWISPHHSNSSLYVPWISKCRWILSPDSNGSYGRIDYYDPIIECENFCLFVFGKLLIIFGILIIVISKLEKTYTDT